LPEPPTADTTEKGLESLTELHLSCEQGLIPWFGSGRTDMNRAIQNVEL
jgi:hypothetical protein